MSQISLKNSSGKGFFFFKIWPKSKIRKIKIGYLAAILKRNNIFFFFFQNCDVFYIARTYMVQILLQNSGGKVVFSGGFHGTLGHLSVKFASHDGDDCSQFAGHTYSAYFLFGTVD